MKTSTAAPSRPWAAALAIGALLAPALGVAQDVPVPDKGDTAWMMTSTVLVILMTIPGLAPSTPASHEPSVETTCPSS